VRIVGLSARIYRIPNGQALRGIDIDPRGDFVERSVTPETIATGRINGANADARAEDFIGGIGTGGTGIHR
jgi:hypothetical protein